jgi:hypothetical protein
MTKHWPRALVTRNGEGSWNFWLLFNRHWDQEDVWIASYDQQGKAIQEASRVVYVERRKASFNPGYRYLPPEERGSVLSFNIAP